MPLPARRATTESSAPNHGKPFIPKNATCATWAATCFSTSGYVCFGETSTSVGPPES